VNRAILEHHLSLTEEHVALSKIHIARQRELIGELERDGHAQLAETAKQLLALFLEFDAMHVAYRDRLRRELSR
jgi:hypothetical protein